MTWREWIALAAAATLGAVLTASLVCSQPTDVTDLPYELESLEDRLQGIEDKLDALDRLMGEDERPAPKPKPAAKPRRKAKPQPVPIRPGPPYRLTEPDETAVAAEVPSAPPRPAWTWAEVEAADAFRRLANGD